MFNIVGGWNQDRRLYWTGKGFSQVQGNGQQYATERKAIAIATHLKTVHPSMFVEIVNGETGETVLLMVVCNGAISTALPQSWEELRKKGFTR
jgi:hypothetical protein